MEGYSFVDNRLRVDKAGVVARGRRERKTIEQFHSLIIVVAYTAKASVAILRLT